MSPERARPGSPAVVYVTSPGRFSARIRANASVMRDAIRTKPFHPENVEVINHRGTEPSSRSTRAACKAGRVAAATRRRVELPSASLCPRASVVDFISCPSSFVLRVFVISWLCFSRKSLFYRLHVLVTSARQIDQQYG